MTSATDREYSNGGSSEAPAKMTSVASPMEAEHQTGQRGNLHSLGGGNNVARTVSNPTATTPPYWLSSNIHRRTVSSASIESVLPIGAITLQDNESNIHNDRNAACWAKSVEIVDQTIINGGATSIGAFVVWIISVETLNGSYMNIRKRYSEFDEFRAQLIQSFPNSAGAVPPLPPKSMVSKFRPRFLDKRRAGLQYFLNCILLNPEFSGSPVLKDFLFA